MRPLQPFDVPLTGTQLIEASAGTGKTYTITTLYLRLLLERELGVDEIVVVTFTKAATAELRDRVRRRIEEAACAFASGEAKESDPILAGLLERVPDRVAASARLEAALRGLDRAAIFTIHGFAQRMLQEHAFESGARFDLQLVGDQRALVTEVAYDFWAREIAPLPPDLWGLLVERRVSLASLVSLAYVAAAWPDLPLHGESQAEDPRGAFDDYVRAWRRAKAVYEAHADAAFALLSPRALHATYFGLPKIARYRKELDAYFSRQPEAGELLPEAAERVNAGFFVETPRAVKKGYEVPQHWLFSAMEELTKAHRALGDRADAFLGVLREKLVRYARERVTALHREAGTQSFDDLLYGLRAALQGRSGKGFARKIRDRHPVALIDEFQDTDPVQYEVFRRVYGTPNPSGKAPALFLIGDPKQAIYAFRGADVYAYLAAARDAADGAWTLTTNFRSDPGVLSALNALYGRIENPFLVEGIRYAPVGAPEGRGDRLRRKGQRVPPVEVLMLSRRAVGRPKGVWQGTDEWGFVTAQEIARMLHSGADIDGRPVEPRDVAVLTRSNAQAHQIQEHLRDLGIPSVLQGDRSVFEAAEADELARVMRALAEPSSGTAIRTALVTRFVGLRADELAALADDERAWEIWAERFRRWHATWAERGFVQAMGRLTGELSVVRVTLEATDGERRLTNLRHLIELLHQAEVEQHLGIVGLLQWFDEVRTDPSRQGMAPEAQQLRLESDAHAVTLTTMHKSKGLEYPIVYLPFLGAKAEMFGSERQNLRFHNPEAGERLELDVRIESQKGKPLEIAERESRAEAMRLAYVALTRAKHHLVILWGDPTPAFSSLGYLLHQPSESLGGLSTDIVARLKSMDADARLAEVEILAEASGGALKVRAVSVEPGPPYRVAQDDEAPLLTARRLRREAIGEAERTSSFSQMVRGVSHRQLSVQAREGRDVDEGAPLVPGASKREPEGAASESSPSTVILAEFPRGAGPGDFLHAVFENAPFAEGDPEARRRVVQSELGRHGFDAEWAPTVVASVEQVLSTPLASDDESLRLGNLARHERVAEMEFTLPVSRATEEGPLSAERLGRALASGGQPAPWPADYPERVSQLGFRNWSGFLRGFIDLVFEHDGRFYVLDYKSNHLGVSPDDYVRDRLTPAMADHHYFLQYLLYSVAVHRYLRQRVVGYSYERHFGGVYYLFVRGISPETGADRGVFFDRPSEALIKGLSDLLDAPGRVA